VSVPLEVPVTGDDHAQGPPDAAYVLVQYGDYECPFTRRSLRDVEVVRAEVGAELRWVFRNFPLPRSTPTPHRRPKRPRPRAP
jgi:protein-disulfide isomerase